MRVYDDALAAHGIHVGQVLLAPLDFIHRQQYLHARQTLSQLLELGVVPVVNENDATSDDEIRFGDNDRLAALVAHLVAADLLVLLTDTPGLLTADPRTTAEASLIEEVVEVDHEFESLAGGPGSAVGSGGMVSKLAAAKIASWSGVETVIADARRPGVLSGAVHGEAGVGTVIRARPRRLPARRLWIAFAVASSGTLVVDEGARRALVEREASLLPVGVVSVSGRFDTDDAVEIAGPDGVVFAKGLVRHPADRIESWVGRRTSELPEGAVHEIVHRDDLVVLG
jgi:glutamate 5-kinase